MQSKNGNAFESRRLAALRSFHSGIRFSFSGYGAPRLGSEQCFFRSCNCILVLEKFPLKKMDDLGEPLHRSIFVLRPFQTIKPKKKTKIPARCARRQEGEERGKQEKKFFDSRIVGPKVPERCF